MRLHQVRDGDIMHAESVLRQTEEPAHGRAPPQEAIWSSRRCHPPRMLLAQHRTILGAWIKLAFAAGTECPQPPHSRLRSSAPAAQTVSSPRQRLRRCAANGVGTRGPNGTQVSLRETNGRLCYGGTPPADI